MVILSAIYPKSSESKFDLNYYLQTHIPMVKSRFSDFGLESINLVHGQSALSGGTPAFELIGHLTFSSLQQMQDGLSKHGGEIIGDIPNFTNIQAVLQVGESV